MSNFIDNNAKFDLTHLWNEVLASPLRSNIKAKILTLTKENKPPKDLKGISVIIAELFMDLEKYIKMLAYKAKDINELLYTIESNLQLDEQLKEYHRLIINCAIVEVSLKNKNLDSLAYACNETIKERKI